MCVFYLFPQVFSLKSSANADGQVVSATISLIAAASWTIYCLEEVEGAGELLLSGCCHAIYMSPAFFLTK